MTTALNILLAGLKTKWDATASLTAAINGPYRKSKPANLNVGFPYCIVDDDPSTLEGYSCGNEYWSHYIDFVVYAKTPEVCATSAGLIDAIFNADSLALTLSAGSLVKRRKTGERYREDDKAVNSVALSYEFQTSLPRTA